MAHRPTAEANAGVRGPAVGRRAAGEGVVKRGRQLASSLQNQRGGVFLESQVNNEEQRRRGRRGTRRTRRGTVVVSGGRCADVEMQSIVAEQSSDGVLVGVGVEFLAGHTDRNECLRFRIINIIIIRFERTYLRYIVYMALIIPFRTYFFSCAVQVYLLLTSTHTAFNTLYRQRKG